MSVRITYVTHTRFPVQKAHGKQIADVCAAMAAIGHTVTLLCPTVSNSIKLSWNRYYDLPESFKVKILEHKDATRQWWVPGTFHFRINMRRYKKALKTFFERSWYLAINPFLSVWHSRTSQPSCCRSRFIFQ